MRLSPRVKSKNVLNFVWFCLSILAWKNSNKEFLKNWEMISDISNF